MQVLKVANWAKHFENNRTRDLLHMAWVPVPNKHDGDGYTELIDHPNGAAHFGAWNAIVQVASRCDPRGTLLREGAKPHDEASLARMTRIKAEVFEEAIPRLISIGWLTSEVVASSTIMLIPQEGAGKPHEGAPSRACAEWNGTEEKDLSAVADPKPTQVKAKAKPRKEATGEHAEFIRHFEDSWKARYGVDYRFVGGKDGKHVQWILDAVGRDLVRAKGICDTFFEDDEPFMVKERHPLGLLVSRFNKYQVTGAPRNGSPPSQLANRPAVRVVGS